VPHYLFNGFSGSAYERCFRSECSQLKNKAKSTFTATADEVQVECSNRSGKVTCKNNPVNYTSDITMSEAKDYCISKGSSLVAPYDPRKRTVIRQKA